MSSPRLTRWPWSVVGASLLAASVAAHAALPLWLQHVVGASSIEAALFRMMPLPAVQALYPRPPKEAQGELAKLIVAAPDDAPLYALRAHADEASLDFNAAESDWKLAVTHAKDAETAKLELADFYHRRMMTAPELHTLSEVAAAASLASERFVDPAQQGSWRAYERMLALIADQGLPAAQTETVYRAFVARYPEQPAVYARFLEWQLDQKSWPAAAATLTQYRKAFPQDAVFPIRAQSLLEYRRGDIDKALEVYDQNFKPLWPAPLVQSYFALLDATHRQRAFVADARARLAAHPDGPEALNALARLFYYQQQAGHLDQAQAAIDSFRIAREARNGGWSAEDLYTLGTLTTATHSYAEAARYDYALASSTSNAPNGEPAAQAGLNGLIDLLLTAPDQPIALGTGNLSLYRDIATLDQGPGYWNGILSLWLNGTSPESEYQAENAKAQSYFHRAKAAELLADLDQRFASAPERPGLHAALIHAYAQYGEPAAVIAEGTAFLRIFPAATERVDVAGQMADAYARQQNSAAEFALYDSLLAELAAKTGGQPLSAAAPQPAAFREMHAPQPDSPEASDANAGPNKAAATMKAASYELSTYTTSSATIPEAVAYAQILDRYVGRLVAEKQIPQALLVLRHQLDANPNDPLLYERLANFLQQNSLSAQQEEVYKLAIAKFQQPTWYDKLARLYLRERNREAYTTLTHQVADIFSGTDLDPWFVRVGTLNTFNQQNQPAIGPQLAIQLNLYAQKRFPHDPVFTRNLLSAYSSKPTENRAAYEALLRRHWWEEESMRNEFFSFLSRNGKLQAELAQLTTLTAAATATANPAATRELGEADVWTSHFEQAAPLMASVEELYPADATVGDNAVSLFRSLAYVDPTMRSTARAVAMEERLLTADPANADRLATLGDLYAEATATGGEDVHTAAPYWRRIPGLHAGTPAGYLTSATIFWDYFQFDDAMAALQGARTRCKQPTLYGYEAGAIEENRRDVLAAVAEYTSAALAVSQPSEPAKARLLQLAVRPATRGVVDQASAKALAANPANLAALNLRADVLVAQHREPEFAPLLEAALAQADTPDAASAIGALAQQHTLTTLYERALSKQIALTSDPVQKIQLSYSAGSSMESRRDVAGASRVIDTVYRDNPRILGVVRATTEFYARNAQPQKAIATLLEASRVATPELARSFTLEAAQRANEAGDIRQARSLAEPMLRQTPYDATVLGIISASYARENDSAGLKAFYLVQLATVKTAPLSPEERKNDIALLRRGLIPALTRLKDYPGAVDQYIALVSAYPEDSATAQEGALYALRYGRQAQLLDFLRTTVKQSPNDSRFAIVLAQVETTFEDLPSAIAAYSQAITIRKDRADLYSARVDLELRLAQNDQAAVDFNRLYVLSYKDPQWMVRLAELRARQQRPADAVKALEAAYITGQPVLAANDFRVADQLAQWNLLAEARTYAEQGITHADNNLLINAGSGAASYARIMARVGKPDEALKKLTAAYRAVDADRSFPAELAAGYARAGTAAADMVGVRQQYFETRRQTARQQLNQAVQAMGQTVQTYYTPEQKAAYAITLDHLHDAAQPNANPALALAAAASVGLTDREAAWRRQILLTDPIKAGALPDASAYIALQQRRLAFAELAQTLEAYALRIPADQRRPIRTEAARAWREAGDETNEMRVTRPLVLGQDAALRDHFFDLLLRHDRAALTAMAASGDVSLADAAANYAVAHATQAQALTATAQRGRALPPVWRPAMASLVLTSFAASNTSTAVATSANFTQALNHDATIAARLAAPVDPAKQLAGDQWFYYAARFGIFLNTVPKAAALPDAEDFLGSDLEHTPSSPAAYLQLARVYAEAGNNGAEAGNNGAEAGNNGAEAGNNGAEAGNNGAEAGNNKASATEYLHALELAPNNPVVHDEFAVVLYRANRGDDALAQWRIALDLMRRRQSGEVFFAAFKSVAAHLAERHLAAALRPELEAILRPYFARNGNYRSNELLRAAYEASATPADGLALIFATTGAAADPKRLLEDLSNVTWLPVDSREAVLVHELALEKQISPQSAGGADAADMSPSTERTLLGLYMDHSQDAQAAALLDSFTALTKKESMVQTDRLLLAAHAGKLEAMIAGFRAAPDQAFELDAISDAANRLATSTAVRKADPASARALREYVFEQKQLTHQALAIDFLALAQSRLDTNDMPGALELLRRLVLQPASHAASPSPDSSARGNVYTNTDSAAALLEAAHHPAEALPFLTSLTQAVPWNAMYRLRLAEAQLAGSDTAKGLALMGALVRDSAAPYALRVQAAKALGSHTAPSADAGSGELTLLTSATYPAAEATRQPYFAAARIAAASNATLPGKDRIALLREAIAIDPAGATANAERLDVLLAEDGTANASATLALVNALSNSPSNNNAEATDEAVGEAEGDAGPAAEEAAADASDSDAGPNPMSFPFALAHPVDVPTQIHLAGLLAAAYERERNLTQAIFYDQLAVNLASANATPDAALLKRLNDAKATVRLEKKNALRAPLIHEDLDQVNQVRPRLTLAGMARAEAP